MNDGYTGVFDTTLGIRPNQETIAKFIKTRRIKHNLTHTELARLIGVSRTTIINYENSKTFPDDSVWLRILLTFNEHPRFLLQTRPQPQFQEK